MDCAGIRQHQWELISLDRRWWICFLVQGKRCLWSFYWNRFTFYRKSIFSSQLCPCMFVIKFDI